MSAATTRPAESNSTSNESRHSRAPATPATTFTLPAEYNIVAAKIISASKLDDGAYQKLIELCDDIGHRISGSPQLDQAIEWAKKSLAADGQENVRTHPVMVPKWVRGAESLALIAPREQRLFMLGLGNSSGTPPEGITADVIVVHDEEELKLRKSELAGKIVLFDHPMQQYDAKTGSGYGAAVRYRTLASQWAQSSGAAAALVRSVTARSIRSPHTGAVHNADRKGVPTAAISTEDADMLSRYQERGIPIRATLKMEAHFEPDAPSANVLAELVGRELPQEIVIISGHLDSWDVGQGAHDDGAGVSQSMQALSLLRKLGLRPRRTIRLVLWTNEENGLAGGRQYAKDFEADLPNHVAAIESDNGGFAPLGFSAGHVDPSREDAAAAQLAAILKPLAPLGATRATNGGGAADIDPMRNFGVVLINHDVDGATYFDYHHTHGDTVDKVDSALLAKNAAAIAYLAYVLADMPGRLGDAPLASPPADGAQDSASVSNPATSAPTTRPATGKP